jgi:hypothetical protein
VLEGLTVVETPPQVEPPEPPVEPLEPPVEPPEPPVEPPETQTETVAVPDELTELGLRGEDGKLDEKRVLEVGRRARNLGGFTAGLDAEARESPEACAAVIRVFKRRGMTVPPELAEIEAAHKAKVTPAAAAPVEEDDESIKNKAMGEAEKLLRANDATGALRATMNAAATLGGRNAKKMLEEAQARIEAQGRQRSAEDKARQELRDTLAKFPEIAEIDGTRVTPKDKEVFNLFIEQAANRLIPLARCMQNALKLAGRSEKRPAAQSRGRPAIAGGGTPAPARPERVPGKAQVDVEVEVPRDE